MFKIYIIFLFFIFTDVYSQLAVIYDKDGYTNVRENASLKSKIIGKIFEGQVFAISPFNDENKNEEWVKVWFPEKQDSLIKNFIKSERTNENGYIHKSRIAYLSEMDQLKQKKYSDQKVSFDNNKLQIIVETKKFIKSEHKIQKLSDGNLKIDNRIKVWGFYGQIPRNQIQSIKLKTLNSIYIFPKEAISHLYEIILPYTQVFNGKKGDVYIAMSAGDGSDSYEIAWCVKNNEIYSMTVMQTIP